MNMNIPFVDLKSQYKSIKNDADAAVANVIENTAFVGGPIVAEFERKYAEMYGVKHCVSVGNGTDAIYITLKMLGIGPGDEVITVANSWISTAEVINQTGAEPVFVDIEPDLYNIDASLVESKISDRTKAIIPVHLYGLPADMDPILRLCKKYDLYCIEDSAQAHFAEYKGRLVGTMGNAGTFSFYPGKNLGAYGDAGCVITNDNEIAEKIRRYANHGSLVKHQHTIPGINSRTDGLQAAILTVKLDHILEWNNARYENAMRYNELLADVSDICTPVLRPGSTHVFHVYCIRTERRDDLSAFLREKGIASQIHYPTALPFLDAYRYLNHNAHDFPIAYEYQDQILSLPMFPELTREQQEYIASNIKDFYTRR